MYWDENKGKIMLSEEEKEIVYSEIKKYKKKYLQNLDKMLQYNFTDCYNYVFETNYKGVFFLLRDGNIYDSRYEITMTIYDEDSDSLLCFVRPM